MILIQDSRVFAHAHAVEDTNYVPFGLLQPALVTQKNRRHSILRTAPESFCKENQRNVCSFILGSTYQVEALFPGTAPRTLPSHLYLEDYRGTCSKFWLHPHPVIQELKAWSRVQSSPHLLQCSLCYTDNQVFCSPCQGAPPVQCITQELAEYVWLHYWEVQVRTGPLLGYCTRWAPGARPHPVPEMWQQLSDRLGKFSIPASTGQPAPATQLPGARWGGHNVTTRWIPQTLPSDTEWVSDLGPSCSRQLRGLPSSDGYFFVGQHSSISFVTELLTKIIFVIIKKDVTDMTTTKRVYQYYANFSICHMGKPTPFCADIFHSLQLILMA